MTRATLRNATRRAQPHPALRLPGFGLCAVALLLATCALGATPRRSTAAATAAASGDTLKFAPAPPGADTLRFAPEPGGVTPLPQDAYGEPILPLAPFGDHLITDVESWREQGEEIRQGPVGDYNRVDRLRLGWAAQFQRPTTYYPRIGARFDYSFQRERSQYGVQLEQPLVPERFAVGFAAVNRTDHNELEQVPDAENSLALLFARQDYRDYFQRRSLRGYAAARFPGVTTASVHFANTEYGSLRTDPGTISWFLRDRELRENPAIDDGRAATISYRLEQRGRRVQGFRAGFYHWVDLERAGHGLGGDFQYTRLLADLRSVLRLTPATTLALRAVAGHGFDGALPRQREFEVGGVDGLRAHAFVAYRGNQMLLGQAEYTVGLWKLKSEFFEGGLHAIGFVDVGRAWQDDAHRWNVGEQHLECDGGLGLSTSEDNLRVYVAKNLHDAKSDVLVRLRLRRPF